MKRLLILALCAALALAKDDRLTRELTDRPAREVAKLLNTHFKIQLRLAENLQGKRITVAFKDATYAQALRRLSETLGQPLHRMGGGSYLIGDDWRIAIERQLAGVVLKQFHLGGPLESVVEQLRAQTKIGFFVDPELRKRKAATVRVKGIHLKPALGFLAPHYKCAWKPRYGVIYIATHARLDKLPKRSPFWDARLPDRRVDLPFNQVSLSGVLNYLGRQTGLDIRPIKRDRDASQHVRVAVRANRIHLANALALTLLPIGWTAEISKGSVLVRRGPQLR